MARRLSGTAPGRDCFDKAGNVRRLKTVTAGGRRVVKACPRGSHDGFAIACKPFDRVSSLAPFDGPDRCLFQVAACDRLG